MAVTQKQIEQAEQEARDEIMKIIRESRSAQDALNTARLELSAIEDELGKRATPYGGGFARSKRARRGGKRLKAHYFPGVPSKILDAKWRVYKDFIDGLERELAMPKTRKEELIMYDRGHTLEELKEMCRKKGLSVSGSKKELIARLI
jgi:hypothetical protein